MLHVKTYLAQSKIDGLGLFTSVPIKKGELVWSFNPHFDKCIEDKDKCALPDHIQRYIERHGFKDIESGYWILDGGNDLYVNHSNTPNVIETGDIENGVTRDLIAARDILAGEELTENYIEFDAICELKRIA